MTGCIYVCVYICMVLCMYVCIYFIYFYDTTALKAPFIRDNPRGYGYWIWKPYLNYKVLNDFSIEGNFHIIDR